MKMPKITADPFLVMVALVVLVPALFFAYSTIHQRSDGRDVKTASVQSPEQNDSSGSGNARSNDEGDSSPENGPQPGAITQAERIAPASQAALPAPSPVLEKPVCDEAAKATAARNRDQQRASEDQLHEQQRVKLLLISTIYRKYWDEEMSRHQGALQNIESTYQAALSAADC